MGEILILFVCLLLISVCFIAVAKSGKRTTIKKQKVEIPQVIQGAFRAFAEDLLEEERILLQEAKITNWEMKEEVEFDKGSFKFYKLEYNIVPEETVYNAKGMALNSKEIFLKAGIKDSLVALFYEETQEIFEISFMPEHRVSIQGGKAYIESTYRNIMERFPIEEYSLVLNNQKITLWDNISENETLKGFLEELNCVRTKAEKDFAYSAQFIDTYENEDIQICSLVLFERKKELIYRIRAKNYKAETIRGISVGSTVQELKEKYSINLSFLEDFNGAGAAYGYIPEDETNCYIAFKVEEGLITEIIITEDFEERPFKPKEGFMDQDVPWIAEDYESKLTEKYAREIYLGQHKSDLDPKQVFNIFVANNCQLGSIIQKGLWKDDKIKKEQVYFAICENIEEKAKTYYEIKIKQIVIKTFINETPIWVVTHQRSQKKRG